MKKELELGGEWELKPVERFDGNYESGRWLKQEIPAHWQELEELKNYTGRVVYKKKFNFSPEPERRYWLKLNGVFYWCAVYLNGFRLGANQGYFVPALFEITELLENGENQLLLEVSCFSEPDKNRKKQILGVWGHWDCLYRDWNPGGIWLPIEILSSGPIAIIDPFFYTLYLHPEYARIEGRVKFDSRQQEEMKVKISLQPENHNGPGVEKEWTVYKGSGVKEYRYWFNLKEYQLWWSWDQGEQNLYQLKIEANRSDGTSGDSYQCLFGVRTFALRDYIAYLNERRIWLKGNNYAPGDYKIRAMTPERYQKDLQLAKEANFNILRVHAHIEKPEFYQLADREGILLWQDFPLQWGYDKSILPEALFQLEEMLKLLYHHPSVVIWCMHNEPIKPPPTEQKPKITEWLRFASTALIYSWNREKLDKQLLKKAKFLDPFRPSLLCSGERGLFRKDHGDAHSYHGWYFGPLHWLNYWVKKNPQRLKLVSEFGAQSFPDYENAIKFVPDDLKNLNWKELAEKYLAQPWLLKKYVPPKKYPDLKSYIQATQDWQSEVNRYYIDRLRFLKYRPCGGAIAFNFIEPNPSIQWSVVDYWREPKSSYYQLKKAFSPVYAFVLIDRPKYKLEQKLPVPILVVNDLNHPVKIELSAKIISPIQEELYQEKFELELEPDCPAQALANPILALHWQGEYKLILNLRWEDNELENVYKFIVG